MSVKQDICYRILDAMEEMKPSREQCGWANRHETETIEAVIGVMQNMVMTVLHNDKRRFEYMKKFVPDWEKIWDSHISCVDIHGDKPWKKGEA